MTDEELQRALFLLGPWLIGSFTDVLFQGVLFCQFSHYYSWHRNDSLRLRLMVLGLAILTTLKSIHSFVIVWMQLIIHFGDLDGAIMLNYTAWWQTGSSLMVATIGVYVQAYFLHRLWAISGHNLWLVMIILIILVFAYLSLVIATYYISQGVDATPNIGIWSSDDLKAGDLMITLSTAFYLIRSMKGVLPQTVTLLSALVRLTFQTAAPASLCAMFNLIFSQVYSGEFKLISVAFNQALPKLYAFSMMWTLNARHNLRLEHEGSHYTSEHSSGRSVGGHEYCFLVSLMNVLDRSPEII
ncbi:hypothetical protein BDQ17DRAFT_1234560 [Cyathus striatus]|nr:hypothetical protein BDQ17DRAFT_1234560 [Cyathus striatus]